MRLGTYLLAVAVLAGCEFHVNGGITCNAQTCPTGCCQQNQCIPAATDTACGAGGAQCLDCSGTGLVCQAGMCVTPLNGTDAGTGIGCGLPQELDFGLLRTNGPARRTFTLTNTNSTALQVSVGAPTSNSGDHGAFSVATGGGTTSIPPAGQHVVEVDITPPLAKSYSATLPVNGGAHCSADIRLVARVQDQLLEVAPASLDFGALAPSASSSLELTLYNVHPLPVGLSNIQTGSALVTTSSSTLIVPAGGSNKLTVTFQPTSLGNFSGTITLDTGLAGQPTLSIPWQGSAGGPDIEVSPTQLDFGQALVPSAPPGTVLPITIKNVGVASSVLKLSANGASTYFNITGPDASDFQALPDPFDPSTGIVAGHGIQLRIAFSPQTVGTKNATLTIYSMDPDEPSVDVNLVGEGVSQFSCTWTVSTPSLDFGAVSPGRRVTQTVEIQNTGTQSCSIQSLAVTGPPEFTLDSPPLTPFLVGPGQSTTVKTAFYSEAPLSSPSFASQGYLEINASSTNTPSQKVSLSAQYQHSCLVPSPSELQFGSVVSNCWSESRQLWLLNVCTNAVTVSQLSLSGPFAIPGGAWATPRTILSGEAVAVPLRFHATAAKTEYGSMTATWAPVGTTPSLRTVVPLVGTGTQGPEVTESLTLPTKTDVLMVVDDSGSMAAWQADLASKWTELNGSAQTLGVDYRLGVTTTDMHSTTAGQLRTVGTTHFLTPQTPNLANAYQSLAKAGTSGSGNEQSFAAAYAALSSPLIASANSGFLRGDSSLSVFFFTDEEEQSNWSTDNYERLFYSLRANRNLLHFTGAVFKTCGPPSSRILDLIARNGGVSNDVCTHAGWNFYDQLMGVRTSYFLTGSPELSTAPLTVTHNGQAVPGNDFSYSSQTGRIDFTGRRLLPGDTVTVRYQPVCRP